MKYDPSTSASAVEDQGDPTHARPEARLSGEQHGVGSPPSLAARRGKSPAHKAVDVRGAGRPPDK
jgi:hypothetical protein